MNKQEKLDKFLQVLRDNGDMYFDSGNIETDLAQIEGRLKTQGYWAGLSLRYYFDEDFNLIKTEERRFGS